VTGEFGDIEERLARYRPATPSEAARQRTEALFNAGTGAGTRRWRLVAACAALGLLATTVWWVGQSGPEPGVSAPIPEEFVQKWTARPREVVPGIGPSHARVSVVLFTDWQCPPCIDIYPELIALVKSYNEAREGTVDLVVRDWPWNSRCNPGVPTEMHHVTCELAAAVRVSRKHGRETGMIDWIRSNRDRLAEPETANRIHDELRRLLAGIDVVTEYAAAGDELRDDVTASDVTIAGTPTIFVNGVRMTNPQIAVIDWAIRLELSRRGGK
jgi:thiol-disulfide isomerase/thioredoxin